MMSMIRKADETLLRIFTWTRSDRAAEDRHQFFRAFVATLILVFMVFVTFDEPKSVVLGAVAIGILALSSFYEWRLWHRLRGLDAADENATSEVPR